MKVMHTHSQCKLEALKCGAEKLLRQLHEKQQQIIQVTKDRCRVSKWSLG